MPKRFPYSHPPPVEEARVWVLRVRPEEIGYVNSIIESHEGLALVRTTDKRLGLLEVWVASDLIDEFRIVLTALGKETDLTVVEEERPADGFAQS